MSNRVFITIIFLSFTSSLCNSQSLKRDELDEFTGDKIKQTNYEVLCQTFKMNAFASVMNVNDSLFYLKLKLMVGGGSVHSIDKGDRFMMKLSDDSIVELENMEYTISCTGCGSNGFMGSAAQGTQATYIIYNKDVERLKSKNLAKIRIYTTDGYVECLVKGTKTSVIRDQMALLR